MTNDPDQSGKSGPDAGQAYSSPRDGKSRFEGLDRDHFDGATGLLFEQAMAQTRMAVCLTDPNAPDDPIVFCNQAFERLTGYPKEEIIGRNCRFLQGARTDQSQVDRIRDALKSEDAQLSSCSITARTARHSGTRFTSARSTIATES